MFAFGAKGTARGTTIPEACARADRGRCCTERDGSSPPAAIGGVRNPSSAGPGADRLTSEHDGWRMTSREHLLTLTHDTTTRPKGYSFSAQDNYSGTTSLRGPAIARRRDGYKEEP